MNNAKRMCFLVPNVVFALAFRVVMDEFAITMY